MILIQLTLPVLSLLYGDKGEEMAVTLEEFHKRLQSSVDNAREDAYEADKRLEEMTLEEVRKRMEEQERKGAAEADSEGNADMGNSDGEESRGAYDNEKMIEIYVEPVVVE